ncbi:MAG: hypothetical protein V3T86_18000 [Planctomycetota bacterium]
MRSRHGGGGGLIALLAAAPSSAFVGQVLAGVAFSVLVFGAPGWVALRGRRPWFAPAVGVCFTAPITLLVTSLLGLGVLTLLLGWVASLAAAYCWGRGEEWARPRGWGLLVVAALGATLISVDLLPIEHDGGLYFQREMFDHTKSATVDAIVREGLPVRNPYYSVDGAPIPLNYYWGAHFCAALLCVGTGIGGWPAEMAMTWYAAFAFLTFSCALAKRWAGLRAAWWALALGMLGVAGDFLSRGLGSEILIVPSGYYFESVGVAPVFEEASWVFQHVLAAVGAGVAMWSFMRFMVGEWTGIRPLILMAFGLATCAMCSVFVAVSTAVGAAFVLIVLRGRGWHVALGGAALAAILALPVLSAMFGGRDAGGSNLIVLRMFYASRLGLFWRPLDLPLFWLQFLPLRLGVAFVAGFVFLVIRRREREWRMALAAVMGALLVMQFARSAVFNNDLGWRASLPVMLFLNAAAGAWRAQATSATARSLFLVGVCIGALATLGHIRALNEQPWTQPEKVSLAQHFAHQPEAWAAVRRHTADSDLVANNPDGYVPLGPWPNNYSWAFFADRPAAISDHEVAWTNSLGQDPQKRGEALALVRAVFHGTDGAEQAARELRDRLQVKALLLDRIDPAWPGDAIERSGAWRAAEVTEHFKVYVPVVVR